MKPDQAISPGLPCPGARITPVDTVRHTFRRIRLHAWACGLCVAAFLLLHPSSPAYAAEPRIVRIGLYPNKPLLFTEKDGHPTGIFVELLEQIAAQEGGTRPYAPGEESTLRRTLAAGQIDPMPALPQRDDAYAVHETPVLQRWSVMHALPGTPMREIVDLRGMRIAGEEGSRAHVDFEQMARGFDVGETILPTDSVVEAFALAGVGVVDAVVAERHVGDTFRAGLGLVKTPRVFNPVARYYASGAGRNADLLAALDRHLDAWIKEPTSPYYTTLAQWAPTPAVSGEPPHWLWVLGGIVGLVALAAGLLVVVRRQVRTCTRALEQANKDVKRNLAEQTQANERLLASETRYRRLFESAKDGILILNAGTGQIIDVNPFLRELTGYSHEEFLGKHLWEIGSFKDIAASKEAFHELMAEAYVRYENLPLETRNGKRLDVEFVSNIYVENDENVIQCNIRDITERRREESRTALATQVMTTLNRIHDISKLIPDILQQLQEYTDMDAVGIRLREGEDYPYFETRGFPDAFLADEQYLCTRNATGELLHDETGHAILECMCGNILRERTDPSMPFFTTGGSFWTNNSTTLLATASAEARQSRTRDRCNLEGYESVALIPLRSGDEIIGLLQLNDHRPDRFNLETIEFYEKLGNSIGIAIRWKQNAEALRTSEERYRTLVDHVPQKIFLKDENSVYVSCNRSYAEDLGIEPEEIVGKTDFDFHPRALAEKYRADDKRILAGGSMEELDEKYVLRGRELWIHTVKTPLMNENGTPAGILGILWDITDIKRAQDEIAALARIPNEDPYPVLRIAADGTVLYSNAASAPLLKFWQCAESQTLPDAWRERIATLLETNEPRHFEIECDKRLYFATFVPIPPVQYVNIYCIDVTRERHAERQLRQTEKMRALNLLAGGVAHEFNNQLAVINGFAELSLRKCADNEALASKLRQILKAGQHAAVLTGQLLVYSRSQDVDANVINVNAIIQTLEPMLRRLIGEDIDVHTELAQDLGDAEVDQGQFSDALINLASNARDAMPTGGTLTLATENVKVGKEVLGDEDPIRPGLYVKVSMKDTGIGMDASTLARLFEPFFTTKPIGKGTGLGLSMVYGVIKKANGKIFVESQPNHGTTVSILLPHVEKAGTKETPDTSIDIKQAMPKGTETILVVEDEEMVYNYIRTCLEGVGYTVLGAESGDKALQMLEQEHPVIHVVLSDVVMPGMHGFEFIKRLKIVYPDVKVLYLSGYSKDDVERRAETDSDVPILKKPVTPVELTKAVRAILDQ